MRQLLLLVALISGVLCVTIDYHNSYFSRQPALFRLLMKYKLWPTNQKPEYERPAQDQAVPGPFIYGGESASIESIPYQLSLRHEGTHICGASVIAERWALSAAHCLDVATFPSGITFRGGTPHRLAGGYIFHAEWYAIHPKFDRKILDYDVAVIRVQESFFVDMITPVSLANANMYYPIPSVARVSGWGFAEDGYAPLILQSLNVYVQSQSFCMVQQLDQITDRMICAGGGEWGKEVCNGDSGGPLVLNGYQIGIVSYGSSLCAINVPGVYTSLMNDEVRAFIAIHANV